MNLTAEAIDKIVSLAKYVDMVGSNGTVEILGKTYYVQRDGELKYMPADANHKPEEIGFRTLTGFVDYIVENKDGHDLEKCQVVVTGPRSARLVTSIEPKYLMERAILAVAEGSECGFVFANPNSHGISWYALENFVISLQAQFVQDDETEKIINWLGCLANEKVAEQKDDGFTQTIQVKTGITTKSNVKIKNPVRLSPYRTFREITQPPGEFVLRLNETEKGISVALFMADGGKWELEAMDNIKEFIEGGFAANDINIPILC